MSRWAFYLIGKISQQMLIEKLVANSDGFFAAEFTANRGTP